MKMKILVADFKIIFVALCISISFSKSILAAPITIAADNHTQTSPLLEFLKKISDEDPSPFTKDLVSKALEDILKEFDFLSEFVDKDASDAEEKLKEEIEREEKIIEDELDKAIDKMLDDAIEEALKDDPEITDDVEVDVYIDFSILDPLDLLNQISAGSFPQKLSFVTPIELRNDTLDDIKFSISNPVTLVDSRGVGILRLDTSTIRVFQVPSPSTFILILIGLFGHLIVRIRKSNS